jgi:hypothetical protein
LLCVLISCSLFSFASSLRLSSNDGLGMLASRCRNFTYSLQAFWYLAVTEYSVEQLRPMCIETKSWRENMNPHEKIRDLGKLHSKELHNLYSSSCYQGNKIKEDKMGGTWGRWEMHTKF